MMEVCQTSNKLSFGALYPSGSSLGVTPALRGVTTQRLQESPSLNLQPDCHDWSIILYA